VIRRHIRRWRRHGSRGHGLFGYRVLCGFCYSRGHFILLQCDRMLKRHFDRRSHIEEEMMRTE
jgi:hypothetical protein